jgi:ATP-dependent DNA helicase RecQ
VEKFSHEEVKQKAILERVSQADKPGIIYVATRRHAEAVTEALQAAGLKAIFYHAGLKNEERETIQAAFMADEVEVIVATIAFGMGIDKPNVRFVFHYDISGSMDAYYQEIGRAGRDEQPAQAILFYYPSDLNIHHFFAGSGQLDEAQVLQVVEAIQAHPEPVNPNVLSEETGLSQLKVSSAVHRLTEIGLVQVLPTGEVTNGKRAADLEQAIQEAALTQEQRQQFEQSRLAMMRSYAETNQCRRIYLLNYFGESLEEPCGHCDNCEAGWAVGANSEAQPFAVNSRVRHESWGEGTIMRYEEGKIFILFDQVGYKTVATEVVVDRGLLKQI